MLPTEARTAINKATGVIRYKIYGNQVQDIRKIAQVIIAHRFHVTGKPRLDVTDKVNYDKYENSPAHHDEEHLQEIPDKVSRKFHPNLFLSLPNNQLAALIHWVMPV